MRERPPTKEQVKKIADRAERVEKNAQGRPGRPSLYSLKLVEEICARIADGESLRTICDDDTMPDRATVLRWLAAHPDFAAKYARAREAQGDAMDEKILAVADACTNETAAADRVKILAYQWRASKLAPKKYGDKIEHTGPNGGPIEHKDVSARDELAGRLNSIASGRREGGDPRKPH
jgi:hypothetical protein